MKKPENLSTEVWQQIEASIYSSNKIAAIKAYREATNSGLKESKDIIEQIAVEMKKEHPEKFVAQKSGCGATLLLFSLLPILYYLYH